MCIRDSADGAINICEMKYAKDEFVIDASYEQRLRDRMSSFSVAVSYTHLDVYKRQPLASRRYRHRHRRNGDRMGNLQLAN